MKKKVVRKHNNSGNCFVCGVNNEWGLHSDFYEMEDGTVAAIVTAKFNHQSYPGRVHGGVICAMLDETMGRAINVKHGADDSAVHAESSAPCLTRPWAGP